MLTEAQRRALQNLTRSVQLVEKLPFRVLAPDYIDAYVMDFEYLVRPNTTDLLKGLMQLEGSSIVALASFEEVGKKTQDWQNDLLFVSDSTKADDYWSFVKRNAREFGQNQETPEMKSPWLILAARMGACSDLGTWCIYGEKFAEIALLGFKQSAGLAIPKALMADFGIEKLRDALNKETFFGEPGNEYSQEQRAILRSAYLSPAEIKVDGCP